MSFLEIYQLPILRWLHIVAMVYWLGGEWGVFQTSFNVINRKLTMDERRRHIIVSISWPVPASLCCYRLAYTWGIYGAFSRWAETG